jgi:hypothetical protein
MKLLIVALFAFSGAAFAAITAPISYHDGTLVSFSMPAAGTNCSGRSEQTCNDVYRAHGQVGGDSLRPHSGQQRDGQHRGKSDARLEQSFYQELFAVSPAARITSPASR